MISVENLCKSFGDLEILKGITENIEKGEKVVIIGPSGSGKVHFCAASIFLKSPLPAVSFSRERISPIQAKRA